MRVHNNFIENQIAEHCNQRESISEKDAEKCHEKACVNVELIESFILVNVLADTDQKYNRAQKLAHLLLDELYKIELEYFKNCA